jgi:prolyl-tRNA synthetase
VRLSQLFTKTSKTIPADETSKNAKLLIQAGFVHKEMAGVYAYLPLGLKVVENIKQIIREEMNSLGSQEIIMTSLQRKDLWEKTGRWEDASVDVWFKSKLKNGTEVGFGWSHEEQITEMMKDYISSYRDLPISVYQFQTKLRNEVRAKSGVMRGREFVMKDLYGYSRDAKELQEFYDSVSDAYLKIFDKIGIGESTYLTFASGGAFTQFSHEFQTVTDAGEDTIYIDSDKRIAVNQEVLSDEVLKQLGLERHKLKEVKAAEVGNIFNFGSAKAEQLGAYFTDEDGNDKPLFLSSYGIGVTRLIGVVVELFSDERGLVWPKSIAPAQVIIDRVGESSETIKAADLLYSKLLDQGIEVLYDDRDVRPGQKFADADLMGIPLRIVVSDKTISAGQFEVKKRTSTDVTMQSLDDILKDLAVKE